VKLPVIAVVGRPNVGKSTFFNRVIGQRLAIVEDQPGVTRDRHFAKAEWNGRHFYIVDTGGMIEGSDEEMDRLIREQVLAAIEEADLVVLLVDGRDGPNPHDYAIAERLRRSKRPAVLLVNKVDNLGAPTSLQHHDFWDLGLGEPLHNQDLRIAQKAWDAGCGLIIIANKWDLVEKETMTAPNFEKSLREKAPFLEWVPILFTSAHTGQRVHKALDLILEVQEARTRRVPTHEVNEVIRDLVAHARPPHTQGHPVKLYYATQVAVKPPTFILWSNLPDAIPESYMRYIQNGFRKAWGFLGAPLRLNLRRRGEDRRGDDS
jgi:GTP-binding protein